MFLSRPLWHLLARRWHTFFYLNIYSGIINYLYGNSILKCNLGFSGCQPFCTPCLLYLPPVLGMKILHFATYCVYDLFISSSSQKVRIIFLHSNKRLAFVRTAECFLIHITLIFNYYFGEFQASALKINNMRQCTPLFS